MRGARRGVGVAQSPVTVEPVHPRFDAAVLDDLGRRLSAVRLAPGGGTAWEQGVPRPWLTSLLADWQQFDAGAFQAGFLRDADGLPSNVP